MKTTITLFASLLILVSSCNYLAEKQIEHHFLATNDTLLIHAYAFFNKHTLPGSTCLSKNRQFLINDITRAVNTCRESLDNKQMPFDLFCAYVLPLSVYNEPIENWREACASEFAHLKGERPEYICDKINDYFKERFRYGERFGGVAKPWSILKNMQFGDCYDMAQTPIFPLRALGIPATIDFTYGWGNANGLHAWNVVYINGKMRPFLGLEKGPNTFNPFVVYCYSGDSTLKGYRYPAKIYRKTPVVNTEIANIQKLLREEDTPGIVSDNKVRDVGADYFQVKEISIANTLHHDIKVSYLAIYNNNQWQVAAATQSHNSQPLCFKSLKTGMLYMPSQYKNRKTIPYGDPFVLMEDGALHYLRPHATEKSDLTVAFLHPILFDCLYLLTEGTTVPTDSLAHTTQNKAYRKQPENGEEYKLYHWNNNRWEETTKAIATHHQIVFKGIPSNALFQLADKSGALIGRCFTVENKQMIWW